ncbi:MAG: hypothetical protein IJD79_01405 [Clostridia bacterium]|nr:hypothetical protein [Clostridia bacterium]
MKLNLKNMILSVDFERGRIDSLLMLGRERLGGKMPLFKIILRDREHRVSSVTSFDAKCVRLLSDGAEYSGFGEYDITVKATVKAVSDEVEWYISVTPKSYDILIESVDYPLVKMPMLRENATGGGEILFPINEGVIVSDYYKRAKGWFKHKEPEFPSEGNYAIFPNMICSQMLSYIFDDCSLYIGAHDSERAVKQIDFFEENGGINMLFRLFSGVSYGERFETRYPIVFSLPGNAWEDCAERYRAWFENNLPKRAKKIKENAALPAWYSESPLVIAYPVRGYHDMDEMKPNKLFPYINAKPMVDEIKCATGARILALLMHWEGTAPWAPPYVWPPFGGVEAFTEFADALHETNDVLGVYCSGFGYTIKSNLLDYNNEDEFKLGELSRAMCADRDSIPKISKICTGQRSGYDICPATKLGQSILEKAYTPLFDSATDYVQILDQNHGGGQYLCFSEKHGHAPTAGLWMTHNMQEMLARWNDKSNGKIFGCESASAEPFIGNLLYNDNRFELNYIFGRPVPFYAYVYHEYIRNFMGNQVCCPFPSEVDTIRYRLAYSFAIGDSMTLSMTPDGDILSGWSTRDFVNFPDKEKTYRFIKNLTALYKNGGKDLLYCARMVKPEPVICDSVTFEVWDGFKNTYPELHYAAYEVNGERRQIIVNPWDEDKNCKIAEKNYTVPALSAIIIDL